MNFELVCLRRLAVFRLAAAFLFVACPMMGQVTGKAMLKKTDYARWHDISTPKISPDGRYVSFEVRYPSGTDTLYVKDTFGNKKYSFAKGRSGRFCSSGKFTVLQAGDTLSIVQLESGQIEKIPGVTQYRVIDENDVLAILRTDKQQNTSAVNLILMSSGRIIMKSEPVASWLFSPANDALAIVSQSDGHAKVNVIKLQPPFNLQEVSRSKGTFSRLQWQDDGNRVTFREANEQGIQSIGLYDLKKNSTYSFTADSLPANWSISAVFFEVI